MKEQVYQVQQRLANKLDEYKGWGNWYVDNNIQEIQELYKEGEQKKKSNEKRIEDEEVILIKPYKDMTKSSKTIESSFIHGEIKNLEQYMKFVHFLMQMRLFKPPSHYQLLCSRKEQDPEF